MDACIVAAMQHAISIDMIKELGRRDDALLNAQLCDRNTVGSGNAANAPVVEALRRKPEAISQNSGADRIKERVMVVASAHSQEIHGALMDGNPQSLISKHDWDCFTEAMKKELAARIHQRIDDEMKTTQVAVAKAAGMSPQRLGNYAQGKKLPDVVALVQIAKALQTSTDWLLGVSESVPPEIDPILVRLLELEGIAPETAQVIAATVREAVQIQRALPNEGDPLLRSRLAAQAAWQSRRAPKPN